MKNIVTIDFDIIMAPSIELYNDSVKKGWDYLLQFNQMKLLTADLIHYQRLTNWLIKIIKKMDKENIYFIEDHGQILKYIENDNEKINIYNIDHHHDCGYNNIKNEKLNCGNWGLKLKELNVLNNFYWIKNKNSNLPPKEKEIINLTKYNLINFNLDDLPIPDKLILCLSEPWIPPTFRPLFYIWLDILNEYYNTKFEIDFERC